MAFLLIIRNGKGTKHFYIESQHIVTKLLEACEGLLREQAGASAPLSNPIDYNQKHSKLQTSISKIYTDFGIAKVIPNTFPHGSLEIELFFVLARREI